METFDHNQQHTDSHLNDNLDTHSNLANVSFPGHIEDSTSFRSFYPSPVRSDMLASTTTMQLSDDDHSRISHGLKNQVEPLYQTTAKLESAIEDLRNLILARRHEEIAFPPNSRLAIIHVPSKGPFLKRFCLWNSNLIQDHSELTMLLFFQHEFQYLLAYPSQFQYTIDQSNLSQMALMTLNYAVPGLSQRKPTFYLHHCNC